MPYRDENVNDLQLLKTAIQASNTNEVIRLQQQYRQLITDTEQYVGRKTRIAKIPTDDLAVALIPPDLPYKSARPVKTTGNGDCLYNAASIYLKGDESLTVHLRLLSACELYLNADFYSKHSKVDEARLNPQIFSTDEKTLFSVLLTEQCTTGTDLKMSVKMEAAGMCQIKIWSSMLQVLSLPNVLNVPVYCVFPDTNHGIRPLLIGMLQQCNVPTCAKTDTFIVMWSRDGSLDNSPDSVFEPNHFCFLDQNELQTVPNRAGRKRKASLPVNDKNSKQRTATVAKAGTILAFFSKQIAENKATDSNDQMPSGKCDASKLCEQMTKPKNDQSQREQMTKPKNDQSQHHGNEEVNSKDDAHLEREKSANVDKTHEATCEPIITETEVSINEHEEKSDVNDIPFDQRTCKDNISPCKAQCCTGIEPYRPTSDALLKESARMYKNRTRSCQLSWFAEFPWLSYCTSNNRVYCYVCRYGHRNDLITFSTKSERTFIIEGFNNWKKSPNRLREHQNSETHREVHEKMAFLDKDTHVHQEIQKQNKEEQATRRKCLLNQLQSLKFLLRQGLAIRGKTPDEGNFSQLQNLRAEDSPCLVEWIQKKDFQSPEIVNEQIQLLGHHLLRSLLTRMTQAKFYSVLADETRDIANKEQLSISIRWVDDNFVVYEDFVGLVQLDATDASTIVLSIKDVLLRLCLPLNCCRGQGYDGASNFMGKINGVAVRIRNEVPQAVVVHCFAHCLNLSLQDSCRSLPPIRDAIDLVKEIVSLIKWSPKRQVLFERIQLQSGCSTSKIKPLCPTRWTVRTEAISSVLGNYTELIEAMETVNATGNDDYSRRAGGVAALMQKFSTYYGLRVSHLLFSATEQLSITLQRKDTCIQDVKIGYEMVSKFCERQRTEDAFDSFYSNLVETAASITNAPCLPRYRKVPKRLDSGQESFNFKDPKAYFRQQYFEAIDTIHYQLERRFTNHDIQVVQEIERILIDSANSKPVTVSDDIKTLYKDDIDIEKLNTQLKLMPDMVKVNSLGIRNVTSIRTICDILNHQPGQSTFMSEVAKVVKIYLTIPVTTATAERSFSTLRRLKTYLRSVMTQDRLNNVMLLHCYKHETDNIDVLAVAKDFVAKSTERIKFFGKF